jgi:hypothetical protein
MDIYTAAEYAYKNGYEAGKASALDQVFEKLKEDLRGYIGLNYLDELQQKYKSEIVNS